MSNKRNTTISIIQVEQQAARIAQIAQQHGVLVQTLDATQFTQIAKVVRRWRDWTKEAPRAVARAAALKPTDQLGQKQALELLSALDGHKNWSTYHALLLRDGEPHSLDFSRVSTANEALRVELVPSTRHASALYGLDRMEVANEKVATHHGINAYGLAGAFSVELGQLLFDGGQVGRGAKTADARWLGFALEVAAARLDGSGGETAMDAGRLAAISISDSCTAEGLVWQAKAVIDVAKEQPALLPLAQKAADLFGELGIVAERASYEERLQVIETMAAYRTPAMLTDRERELLDRLEVVKSQVCALHGLSDRYQGNPVPANKIRQYIGAVRAGKTASGQL